MNVFVNFEISLKGWEPSLMQGHREFERFHEHQNGITLRLAKIFVIESYPNELRKKRVLSHSCRISIKYLLNPTCVCVYILYIASKRMELESPRWSDFEALCVCVTTHKLTNVVFLARFV